MCIRDRLRRYARDETANGGPARTPGGGYRQAEPVPAVPPQSEGASVMALLRRLIGDALRAQRLRQNRTLREVSAAARVSLGYLSEVERGQKEASSELLAAICTALGVRLADLLRDVSDSLGAVEPLAVPETVPDTVPALEPVGADAPLVFADRGATGAAIPLVSVSEHAHRAVVAA